MAEHDFEYPQIRAAFFGGRAWPEAKAEADYLPDLYPASSAEAAALYECQPITDDDIQGVHDRERSRAFMHEGRKPFIDVGERFTVTPIVNGQAQMPIAASDNELRASLARGVTHIVVAQADIDGMVYWRDHSPETVEVIGRSPVTQAMAKYGYFGARIWAEAIAIPWTSPRHCTYYPVPEDALRAEQLWNSGLPIAPFDFWFYPTEIEGNGPQTLTMPTI